VTYEIMAAYWPGARGDPFADLMNGIPKIVFSRTLKDDDVSWSNTRIVKDDAVDEIRRIKNQQGGDIGIGGSINLLHSLIDARLIDRFRPQVHPVALGKTGKKPVFEGRDQTEMKLIDTTVLDSRVVVLEYQLETRP